MIMKRANVWLGAAAIVENDEKKWLVVKKTYGGLEGLWSFPAGFVEANETIDEGAVREVKEETGIDAAICELVAFRTGVLEYSVSDHMAIFLARPKDERQQICLCEKEIADVAWLSRKELQERSDVSEMVKEMSRHLTSARCELGDAINPGDQFGYTSYKLFYKKD